MRKNPLARDTAAGFDVSNTVFQWALAVVGIIALFIIVANLFPTLTDALVTYNTSEPIFGAVLTAIVPILIGVGLLLLAVTVFLSMAKSGGGGGV